MNEKRIAVLLVEDDRVDQMAIERLVASEGLPFDYVLAGSASEARQCLQSRRFDVIVLDYRLGDGTAFDILEAIEDTPVVMVTGSGDEEVAVRAMKRGVFDYLVKDPHNTYLKALPLTIEKAIRKKMTERTRKLEYAMIRAESVTMAKSEFLANMSHEMTTPLTGIIGFSEILIDELYGKLNTDQLLYVGYIHECGKHLFDLLAGIFSLIEADASKMQLRLGTFLLRDILNAALTTISDEAVKHALQLNLAIEPDADILIEADAEKLTLILNNLLSNAVKFTPDGGRVSVAAHRIAEGIEIAITDTGIGIEPEERSSLFQMFKQVGSPYIKKHGGIGVGLLLAKKMVELHGGGIWFESEPGKGSTFSFVLPVNGDDKNEEE